MSKDKWLNLFKLNVEYLLKLKNFSTCKYVKVAAILCQKKSLKIVSFGWNGTPPKVLECNEAHDMILKILEKHITTGYELKFCAQTLIIDYSQKYSPNVLIDKYSPLIIKAVENVMENFDYAELYNAFILKNKEAMQKINEYIRKINPMHNFELHAEENALLRLQNIQDSNEYILICTHTPCIACARRIKTSGLNITDIYYVEDYFDHRYNADSKTFFDILGVKLHKIHFNENGEINIEAL